MTYTPDFSDKDKNLANLAGFRLDEDSAPPSTAAAFDEEATPSWTSNPLIQLGIVAGVVGAVFLALYMMLGNLSFRTAKDKEQPPPATDTVTIEHDRSENGRIKTGLAFGEQEDDLAALSEPDEQDTSTANNEEKPTTKTPTTTARTTAPQPPPTATPVRYSAPPPAPAPVRPAPMPAPAPVQSTPPQSTEPASPDDSSPAAQTMQEEPDTSAAESPTEEVGQTVTLASGTRISAVVETPVLVASNIPLKSQIRLTEPLTTAGGDIALPTGTLLIAEAVTTGDDTAAYLRITGVVVYGDEHRFLADAVLALGADGGPLRNANAPSEGDGNGIDIEQILVTGALGTLDLERDDLLGGIALGILDELGEQETTRLGAALRQEDTWVIEEGTELIIHINQPVTLPKLESPALPATSDIPHSLIGLGSVPSSYVTVVLRPEKSETISFLSRDETIQSAWLSDEAMVALSYDAPLAEGTARLIHARLKDGSDATVSTLDVVTETAAGKRRWHRFQLHRG